MKNKIFKQTLLLILVIFSSDIFSQSVTINVTNVNGSSINSSTPITLNTNSIGYVSLETQVTLPNPPSDSYPGTIKIYYQRNSTYPSNVANGGDGGGLLFLGSTTAYRYFNITLNSSQFDPTGGYIYAEYQTYSGLKYKSSNRSVVISTSTGGTGGTGGTSCHLFERVPYGGIPLLPKLPTNGITSWVYSSDFSLPFYLGRSNTVSISNKIRQKQQLTTTTSYSCEFWIDVITPFYNTNITRFDIQNNIQKDQYISYGAIPQTIIGDQARVYYSTGGRNGTTTSDPLNNYQWQMRIAKPLPFWNDYNNFIITYGWKNIPNATQQNYSPQEPITQATEYRRLIIDSNSILNPKPTISSNVIGIYPINNSDISNTICCDQEIFSNQTVSSINGSTVTLQNVTYQWQTKIQDWVNIEGANDKDYIPITPELRRLNSITYELRRIVISNELVYYPSNSIMITFRKGTNRMAFNLEDKSNLLNEEITLYPNPATTSLYVKNIKDNDFVNLNIVDLTGRVLYSNKITNLESNEFPIDISNLPKGIYNLIIDTNEKQINFKFVKE